MAASQSLRPSVGSSRARVIDLGGQAVHVFQLAAPLATAYEYFLDIPAVLRLLPDTLDVSPYSRDHYRLIVGATDGHGHSMSAIFDLRAECASERFIRIAPATETMPINLKGLTFRGALWAEAIFKPGHHGTAVEYTVEIDMSIPIPGVLHLLPQTFLQNLGETAMTFKMTQMINGFARDIEADFNRWIAAA